MYTSLPLQMLLSKKIVSVPDDHNGSKLFGVRCIYVFVM